MNKSKAFLQKVADQPPPCVTINDPELFFPKGWGEDHTFQIKLAQGVCRRCPLKAACLEFALDTEDQHAILAGTTPADRDVIRRRREQVAERNDPYTNSPEEEQAA